MRRSTLSGTMVALSLALLPAPAARAQSTTRYYVCLTRDFAKRVGYVSPIFAATGPQAEFVKVGNAWGQLLTSKYGDAALPYYPCSQGGYDTPAQAKTARDRFIALVRDQMHQPIVDVDWTYGSAPALAVASDSAQEKPAAPAAKAAPAAPTAADRTAALAEVANSKGYCEHNMRELRALFDCDCFAQMVLHHRLAHPEEREVVGGGEPPRPPSVPALISGLRWKLDCAECLTDQRIAAYISAMMHMTYDPALRMKAMTQEKVDAIAACTTKGFAQRLRAKPYVEQVRQAYDDAYLPCAGSRP
ncbi:MAG TPA: hypothetical protein VFQ38_08990 [Longimicrobiales bacterium]|nr:hypothetical protein [Longimicrobiales bacterium]